MTEGIKGIEGEWVVVHNNKVVAHGKESGDMLKFAERYKEDEVFVTKILAGQASFY
jgi:hypothetical protein